MIYSTLGFIETLRPEKHGLVTRLIDPISGATYGHIFQLWPVTILRINGWLALDPNYAIAHYDKAEILHFQGRQEESIAEAERALALDPTAMEAYSVLGWDYWFNGQFEKSLEAIDMAIWRSPFDRALGDWYHLKAAANYALKQYDRNIEFARRAIAINPTNFWPHGNLIGGLALTGHQPEAREALQNYLASVPGGPKTIAAFKAITAQIVRTDSNPRLLEAFDLYFEGLRKAGLPEE